MKKTVAVALLASLIAAGAWAQTSYSSSSANYRVISETSQGNADLVAKTMQAFLAVYNDYFHFDLKKLPGLLTVRVFRDKQSFDAYLTKVISSTRDDFVYLHYSSFEKSELVVFQKDEAEFTLSLAHQGFIQFIKSFIANPPLWMREGFAVYFESLKYDASSGQASFKENLAWLETVKTIMADPARFRAPEALLLVGSDAFKAGLQDYYPLAWAFSSFLIHSSNKEANRLFTDSILLLSKDGTLETNSQIVLARAYAWIGKEKLLAEFSSYIDSRKTFPEVVSEGVSIYSEAMELDSQRISALSAGNQIEADRFLQRSLAKFGEAEAAFAQALAMNEKSYVPHYYLGLIAYNKKDFGLAEKFYRSALDLGADSGITKYALGVNAFADNRFEDAKIYLEEARQISPERYDAKVQDILKKME
jgi:tetratricopeptide (TPR) repeat protein